MRISERDIKVIRASTEQSRAEQSRCHAGAIYEQLSKELGR